MAGQKYNAVSLSLKLGKKGANAEAPAVATGASSGNAQDWPPSLQRFVSASFSRAGLLEESKKTLFSTQIQELVGRALESGRMWENDWLRQKLPVLDPECATVELECEKKGAKKREREEASREGNALKKTDSGQVGQSKLELTKPVSAKGAKKAESSTKTGSPKTPRGDALDLEFDSLERRKQRMQRFTELSTPEPSSKISRDANGVIIGLCQNLEKNYLRLTSEPDPARVRPQKVLEKSVAFVKQKYAEGASYAYFNDQFKSIRQDLTVQHIRNDFTQLVYETHARTAIENSDLGEYNQCQSQLTYLYHLRRQRLGSPNHYFCVEMEFICYRILYMLMTGNHSEIYKIRLGIYSNAPQIRTPDEKELYKHIKKAFELQAHHIQSDYHLFFEVYEFFKTSSLPLAYHLIKNYLVARERVRALVILTKGYRKVPVLFLVSELKLAEETETKTLADSQETKVSFVEEDLAGFLQKHKLSQFVVNGTEFDCVASRGVVQSITVQLGFRKIDIKGQV